MVHHDHRHSSYYPSTTSFSHNKNYQQHQKSGSTTRSGSLKNNNNNNNGSSSPTCSNPVNDNDTFVRFWPASGSSSLESSCHPCGVVNGRDDVRWSKLLRHDGTPSKVLLYPEEGWARTATNAYWLLSIPWWNRNRCKVVEVAGTRRSTTQAKLIDAGRGTVYVVGSFKNNNNSTTTNNDLEPEFKLALTSHISPADVNLGYLMTGTLERGRQGDSLQPTHFAVLRKFDCNNQ